MKITEKTNFYPKVLFYTTIPRLFRTTFIGHLYEISQIYPTVLLSEKLDSETERILHDKKLFPKLEKIIPVRQYGQEMSLWAKNKYFYKTAKDAVQRYKPDIVIAANDMYPFEMYLMRFAKKINATPVCFQSGLYLEEAKLMFQYLVLRKAYSNHSFLSPPWVKKLFIRFRKHLGHFFYHWILPLTVGESPLIGKSSFVFPRGNPGARDADYAVVFSERDRDIYIKEGVPAEKVCILTHPLGRKTKRFFEKTYFSNNYEKNNEKILTVMWPNEKKGFKQGDHSLISEEEEEKKRKRILNLTAEILKGWKIFIKPHPAIKDIEEIKKNLESISGRIKITNPLDPADKYIGMSDVIMGPAPASTALFEASLQCPEKPILSLDLDHELLGGFYKNFEEIEYIDSEEKFVNILKLIRDNKYQKRYRKERKDKLGPKEFSSATEVLNYVFQQKMRIKNPTNK